MPVRRSRFVALLAVAPVIVARPARAQQATVVRIGAVPSDSYAEPYYATDGGFFARAGINAQVASFTSGAQITTAVAAGALDCGLADPIQVGAGYLRGVGFAYFAGGVLYSSDAPTTQLCTLKSGPIKAAKDLAGQTIGVFGLRSMPVFSTREWLKANGVDVDAVKFVELSPSAMVPAISRGTIAAGVVVEPELSIVSNEGVVPLAKIYDYCAKSFLISSWFAKREWLTQNAATARKLVQAIYETARWADTHHPETLAILAKVAKMEPEKIAKMTRARYATSIEAKDVEPPIALATKYQMFEKPLTATDLIFRV
jgi:ABC-type nitrate/sulfonate/bicarbonate transport system substrate-binding protein